MTDIRLPDINGYEVYRKIREHRSLAKVPVIALSASALTHDIEQAKKMGFAHYLTKPVDINAVLDIVGQHIIESRSK